MPPRALRSVQAKCCSTYLRCGGRTWPGGKSGNPSERNSICISASDRPIHCSVRYAEIRPCRRALDAAHFGQRYSCIALIMETRGEDAPLISALLMALFLPVTAIFYLWGKMWYAQISVFPEARNRKCSPGRANQDLRTAARGSISLWNAPPE